MGIEYLIHIAVSLFSLAPVERGRFALALDVGFTVYKSTNKDECQKQKINGPSSKRDEPARSFIRIERV